MGPVFWMWCSLDRISRVMSGSGFESGWRIDSIVPSKDGTCASRQLTSRAVSDNQHINTRVVTFLDQGQSRRDIRFYQFDNG